MLRSRNLLQMRPPMRGGWAYVGPTCGRAPSERLPSAPWTPSCSTEHKAHEGEHHDLTSARKPRPTAGPTVGAADERLIGERPPRSRSWAALGMTRASAK